MVGTIFTNRKILRFAMVLITALAATAVVACGGSDAPAAPDPTIVPPTASREVVRVTPAPVPTETPVPTATAEPTAEPTVQLNQDLADEIIAITKSLPVVEFPAAIMKGAERLDSDQVKAEWAEFLSGSRTFALNGVIFDWCSDGSGTWVYEVGTPGFTGAKFDWELVSDPGGSWNTIIVVIRLRDQKLYDLMNYAGGDGFRLGLAPPDQGGSFSAFKSPDCD